MKPETTIVYKGVTCRILTEPKYWDNPIIGIENVNGKREPFLQLTISQDEFKRALKGKPQPKFEKGKAFRIYYEGKAVSDFMSYALCVNKKKDLEKTGHYKYELTIGQ